MKKYIYVTIGIFLLAGLVFASTNTGLLQGNSREIGGGTDNFGLGNGGLAITQGADGNTNLTTTSGAISGVDGTDTAESKDFKPKVILQPGETNTGGTGNGGNTPDNDNDEIREKTETNEPTFEDSKNIATNNIKDLKASATDTAEKGTPKLNQVSSGTSFETNTRGTTSSDLSQKNQERETPQGTIATKFFIYLEVYDEDGKFISGLTENNFSADKKHEDFKEQTSFYSFEYKEAYNVKYTVEATGYNKANSSKVTAVPRPTQTETVTLRFEEEAAACIGIYIGADGGSTLSSDETERAAEIDVTVESNSKDWKGSVIVTNTNDTDMDYSGTLDHESSPGKMAFHIEEKNDLDIEFQATLTPGATFTSYVLGEESSCTASFTVEQEEPEQAPDALPTDSDADGISDDSDNCPSTANADQSDIDADGIGDLCDPQNDSLQQISNTNETPEDPDYEEYYAVTADVDQPEYETGEIYSCDHSFSDIQGTINEATICWLAEEGVINGKSETDFGYMQNITVAEYLKILLILSGESPSSGRSSFTNGNHWGEGWLVRAEELDVLRARDGFPANVNHPITRADAALYAMRLIQQNYYPTSSPYTDVSTNDYFGYAVIYLSDLTTNVPQEGNRSVLEGYDNGSFKPYSYIKRGEAVSLLSGMFFALFQ